MSSERRAKGLLLAAVLWCAILGTVAGAYRFVIQPYFSGRLQEDTGSASQYDHAIRLGLDSFTGYAILRSPVLRDQMKEQRIRLDLADDGGDIRARMQALRDGELQMAAVTIDSFLANGAVNGEFPGSIVLVLDETQGADGIVAYKDAVGSLQDLDDPAARFVLTPNSPSEFLARIVLAHFSLPSLPKEFYEAEDGAAAVYNAFRAAPKTEKRAYVLWEPYLSRAIEEPGAAVLLDSSKLKGYVIDVLVAERRFLAEQPELARQFVETYLRTAFSYSARDQGLTELVMDDARQTEPLTEAQAAKLTSGIAWKTTLDNYAHFGILPPEERAGAQHIEDILGNIARVLIDTGATDADPVGSRAHVLYYDRILRQLHSEDFHPSRKSAIIEGIAPDAADLGARTAPTDLPPLSDAQWEQLTRVGELRVQPIAFARGTARLNVQSQRDLAELGRRLQAFPGYYLTVVGHARAEGDPEANRRLAIERAEAAAAELRANQVHPNRIRVVATDPAQANGSAQSVSFTVGRPAY